MNCITELLHQLNDSIITLLFLKHTHFLRLRIPETITNKFKTMKEKARWFISSMTNSDKCFMFITKFHHPETHSSLVNISILETHYGFLQDPNHLISSLFKSKINYETIKNQDLTHGSSYFSPRCCWCPSLWGSGSWHREVWTQTARGTALCMLFLWFCFTVLKPCFVWCGTLLRTQKSQQGQFLPKRATPFSISQNSPASLIWSNILCLKWELLDS